MTGAPIRVRPRTAPVWDPRTVATGVSQFARMRSEDLRCGVLQPWAVGKAPSTAAASCKEQRKNRAKTGDEQETAIRSTKRASVLRLATGSPSSKPWRPLRCDNAGRPSANLVNTYLCKILVTHASEIVPADPRRIQCQPFPGYVSFLKIWARWAAFEASIGGQSASA